jgi:hypothetical protein
MICFSRIGKFGRLGNQLFQIAAAIGLAKTNNDSAKFYKWEYSKYFKFPLDQSLNRSEITNTIHERGFNYSPLNYIRNSDLIGYFQSEKYFKNCKEDIRHYFTFSDSLFNNTGSFENSCSIHVRRGDYVNLQDYHPFPGMDYYRNAIDYMKNNGTDIFYLFSDDIEWCKEQFSYMDEIIYVEGNIDIKDLALMSICKNNIIANSSFSWWGAWLNKNDDKIVIAPSTWFGPSKRGVITEDLYCEGWIKM